MLFRSIRPIYGKNMEIGSVVAENGSEKIKLSSKQSQEYDIWAMQYFQYGTDDKQYKLSELATMEKGQMPQQVAKENQQYRLCLQYEYIGSGEQGNKILKRDLEEFNKGCFKELNRILVVKKIMAITTSKSKYCLLSFFPQPQLSLSD